MVKQILAACAALFVGATLLAAPTEAEAGYRRCGNCGPIKPVYTYRTVNRVTHRTQYRDVSRVHYVQRIRRIVHVTRIQPIVRLHVVTRVNHRTVAVVRPVHVSMTQYLPTRTYQTSSVINTYSCGCR